MTDRNFDDLAKRFEEALYARPRGQLRLQLVSEALLQDCASIDLGGELRVLDVGCGLGQMSQLLANRGHRVTACDLSANLLERAQQRLQQEDPHCLANIQFLNCSLQDLKLELGDQLSGKFDLVIFHAVLEWLEQPRQALQALLPWLRSGGELSLMFYNVHSLIFRNLLRGDFRRIDSQNFSGDDGGLTPSNPLDPEQVTNWLIELEVDVISRRGIRCFFDFMTQANTPARLEKIALEDVLRMERLFATRQPYRGLARYQLWHCVKTS
jgi:S-adenosylmethionine-dependent methyltransferase